MSNKTLSLVAIAVAVLTFAGLWGMQVYRLLRVEAKIAALERVDTVTGETVAEMLDLIEMMIRTKKSPAGYQAIEGPPLCVVHENNTERYLSCDEAWLIRKDAEPPCLAQMEAAMRAWDEFVNYNIMPHENTPQEIEDRVKGIQLWNDAKKDCWRQP
jgi:hypothetical protein